jgi:secretion/DNA translocation related TadE-like protein
MRARLPALDERGAMTVLTTAYVALAIVIAIGLTRVGAATVLQARAQAAADVAALAAADELASGRGNDAARRAAAAVATDNGAHLVLCWCETTFAEVQVALDGPDVLGFPRDPTARARAEVDFTRARAPGP